MVERVAFIPARKGSKGLPGKNKKLFCGKPLIQWSIDQAMESKVFERIVVSSDDEDILAIANSYPSMVTPHERHSDLASDTSSIEEALYDFFAREENKCEYICLLNPTSPLRTTQDIIAMEKFIHFDKYYAVISVKWCDYIGWVEKPSNQGPICSYNLGKRPNRQTRDDFYLENGAIYWFKHEVLIAYGNMVGNPNKVKLYEMPLERSLEIDTPFDFYLAERAYEFTSMEATDQGVQQVVLSEHTDTGGVDEEHQGESVAV